MAESDGSDRHSRLGGIFDAASELYQRARPDYPEKLIDRVIDVSLVRSGDHLVEVGCATGKATLPFARRDFRVTGIEPGPNLVAVARRNLAAYPQVTITQARFEDWRIAEGAPCDLVFAANAWHWLDPELRYQRASQALRPQGHLAIWNAVHVLPEDGDPFFLDIQDIYQEIGEAPTAGAVMPRPEELADQRHEIEASGLFDVVDIGRYDWETVYEPTAMSSYSTRSPGTSLWSRGKGSASTGRSAAASPSARMGAFVGIGEASSTSHGGDNESG